MRSSVLMTLLALAPLLARPDDQARQTSTQGYYVENCGPRIVQLYALCMDIQQRMQDEQPTTVNSETCDEASDLARNACGHGQWNEMLREEDAKKKAALMSRLYSSAVQDACQNTLPSLDPKDSTKAVPDQCLKMAKLMGDWVADTEGRANTQTVKPAKGNDADGAKPAQAAAQTAK